MKIVPCLSGGALLLSLIACGTEPDAPKPPAAKTEALSGCYSGCYGNVSYEYCDDAMPRDVDCAAYGGRCVEYSSTFSGCEYPDGRDRYDVIR